MTAPSPGSRSAGAAPGAMTWADARLRLGGDDRSLRELAQTSFVATMGGVAVGERLPAAAVYAIAGIMRARRLIRAGEGSFLDELYLEAVEAVLAADDVGDLPECEARSALRALYCALGREELDPPGP